MKRLPLYFSFISFGTATLTIQIILIRELLVIFSGNELSIGLFLSQWLFAQAAGSSVFSKLRLSDRNILRNYVLLFTSFTGIFPIIIFLIRIIKPTLGILPGEQVSFFTLSLISFIIFLIPGFIGGALFSTACRLYSGQKTDSVKNISYVYGLEAAGCLIGGLLATYIGITYLYPIEIAFGVIILGLISGILLLSGFERTRHFSRISSILTISSILILVIWSLGGVETLRKKSLSLQWQPYEVKDYHNTVYGNIIILQRSGQMDVLLNGTPVAHLPTPDIITIEEIAHLSMLSHSTPHRVLLLGNGIDGVIPEILKHPVIQLDYVEPDSVLLDRVAKLMPDGIIVNTDPRLNIIYSDGREFLNTSDKKYDLIILNFPEPSTLNLNRFYTSDFFYLCKLHLSPSGILVFRIPSSSTYLNQPSRKLNATLIRTSQEIFQEQFIIPDDFTTIILSDSSLSLSLPGTWYQRQKERDLRTRLLSELFFILKLDSLKSAWYTSEIQNVRIKPNNDLHPSAVWYSLSVWISLNEPGLLPVINIIEKLKPEYIIALIISLTLFAFFSIKKYGSGNNSIIYIPVFTTGFGGMSLSILLALLFQACYGYIYSWLGFLVAAFMTGLALGTLFSGVRRGKNTYRRLLYLELLFLLLLVVILVILSSDFYLKNAAVYKYLILFMATISGILVGAEFPASAELKAGLDKNFARSASGIYAVDLLGACFGGILTSVIFIPVFGILETIYILLFLKTSSIILLMSLRSNIKY